MKKNTKSYRKTSTIPLIFFKDDLEELEHILNKENLAYSIESKEYIFDNISELIKQSNEMKIVDIKIRINNPYIIINLFKNYTEIYASDISDIQTSGIVYNVEALFKKSSRKPIFIYSYKYSIPIIILFILFTNQLININLNKWIVLGILIIEIFIWFWIIYGIFIKLKNVVKIIPYNRIEKKGFYEKNKDQIILGIGTSIFGAIAGGIITYFLTKIN